MNYYKRHKDEIDPLIEAELRRFPRDPLRRGEYRWSRLETKRNKRATHQVIRTRPDSDTDCKHLCLYFIKNRVDKDPSIVDISGEENEQAESRSQREDDERRNGSARSGNAAFSMMQDDGDLELVFLLSTC